MKAKKQQSNQQVAVINEPAELQQEALTIVQQAAMFAVIDSPEEYAMAGEIRKAATSMKKKIADFFKPLKQKADEAKRVILDAERAELDPVERSIRVIDEGLLGWQRKQEKIRREEEARLRKIAERQAELKRQQEALELEEAGADEEEVEKVLDAPLVVVPVVAKTPEAKVEGLVTRTLQKVRVTDKRAVVAFVAAHLRAPHTIPGIDDLLEIDMTRALQWLRGGVKIPGLELYTDEVIAGQGGRR